MPNTFELIASSTVGSGGAASIDFSSIPNTFTDLQLVCSLRTINSATTDDLYLRFNGSTASNYSFRSLQGNGASASSANGSGTLQYEGTIDGANATSSTFANVSIYIPNYAGSTAKSASADTVMETNATTAYATLVANLWTLTSAINQITLIPGYNNFAQYSTAYLYGVKNA